MWLTLISLGFPGPFPHVGFWVIWPLRSWAGVPEVAVENCLWCARDGQGYRDAGSGDVEHGIVLPEHGPFSPHMHPKCLEIEIFNLTQLGLGRSKE